MPEISVWPVSSLFLTMNVGSSSASLARAMESFSWSAFVFGSMAIEMTGVGNVIDSRMIGFAGSQSVSPVVVCFRPDERHDVAGEGGLLVLPVVGVHLQDAADPLLAVLRRVLDVRAGEQRAGVHPDVGEAPDERVGHDLERERGERRVVPGRAADLLAGLGVDAAHRRDVDRRGQVVHDRVEQGLDALVLERRSAEHRGAGGVEGGLAQRAPELLDRRLLLVDELLHEGLVVVGQPLEQAVTPLLGRGQIFLGDLPVLPLLVEAIARPVVAAHLDQVDDAVEALLDAPRKLDDQRDRVEPVLDHGDRALEVGAGAVHLVDEADPRHVVAVGLAPDGLGLRLDAGDGVEHRDGAVEHAQRPLDLDGEVHVAGRVDDVDPVVLPHAGGRGGGDRDAALPLLDHPVHLGGALVDLTDLVGLAGVVEDALGRGRLARVDVGHDPDVARAHERVLPDQESLARPPRGASRLFRCLRHLHVPRWGRH